MRAAQELLGVPTIGGGIARPGGGGGGSQRSQLIKHSKPHKMYENGAKMAGFPHILSYKAKMPFLLHNSTLKNILPRHFLRNTLIFKNFVT
jgi:hypothetical protein